MSRIDSVDMPLNPKTLSSVQAEVDELVTSINAVIDEGFELQVLHKSWIARKALIAEFHRALQDYTAQLDKLRDSYGALCAKLCQPNGKHHKKIVKLYHTLRARYEREAIKEKCQIPPVYEWEIPLAFKVPRPVIPTMSEPSAVSLKITHKLFNATHHYHSRTYWTLRGAESRLASLRKIAKHQEMCKADREKLYKIAISNVELADEEIKQLTDRLSLDKYSTWGDSYTRYANLILQYFTEIDNKVGSVRRDGEDAQSSTDLGFHNYNFVNSDLQSFSEPSYLSEVSEFRCMSGPDINKDPYAVTVPNHRNHSDPCGDMRIEWSSSCSTYNMVPETIKKDTHKAVSDNSHFKELTFSNAEYPYDVCIPAISAISTDSNEETSQASTPDTPIENILQESKHYGLFKECKLRESAMKYADVRNIDTNSE